MDIKEIAKKIAESIPDSKIVEYAQKDCSHYLDNFLYNVDVHPEDYGDIDDIPSAYELEEKFYEELQQDDDIMYSSDLTSKIADEVYKVDEIDENDGETIDKVITVVLSVLGYDSVAQCIYKAGWEKENTKLLEKATSEIDDYFEDQKLQEQDQEEMKSRSYSW